MSRASAVAGLVVGLGITWLTTAVCGDGSPPATPPTATPTTVAT